MKTIVTLVNGKRIQRKCEVVCIRQLLHPSGMKWAAFTQHFGGEPVWEALTTKVKSITISCSMSKAKTKVCVKSKR
jgi:hypothetical protein